MTFVDDSAAIIFCSIFANSHLNIFPIKHEMMKFSVDSTLNSFISIFLYSNLNLFKIFADHSILIKYLNMSMKFLL